jgi:hypothetical protein
MLKTIIRTLLLFSFSIFAQTALPTFTITNSINCQAQGCQSSLMDGDSVYLSAWGASGSFVYNGSTISGAIFGTWNDGTGRGCGGSSNVGILKINGMDFATPSNGGFSIVNCMTSFGTGASNAWAPAAYGTCSATHTNGCSWKSDGLTHVNGRLYLQVFRQDNGNNAGLDSTILVSNDDGATWLNPAHIGGTPNASGDAPGGPGSADYPASILFPATGPTDGSGNYTARLSFVNYCKDESAVAPCPSIDNNSTYTYIVAESGDYARFMLGRWPKTSMPTLDISTLEWYTCPSYNSVTTCDGNNSTNWDRRVSTAFKSMPFAGALPHIVWDQGKSLYISAGFNGGDGSIYLATAPHIWGPWSYNANPTPEGACRAAACTVFAGIALPTLADVDSTQTTFAVTATSSNILVSGSAYHYKLNMNVRTSPTGPRPGPGRGRRLLTPRGKTPAARP